MTGDIGERLAELRAERDRGYEMLAEVEAKASELRSQLLRIEGAVQVLEELLDAPNAEVEG